MHCASLLHRIVLDLVVPPTRIDSVEELGRVWTAIWSKQSQEHLSPNGRYQELPIFIYFIYVLANASHPHAPEQAVNMYSTAYIQPQQPVDEMGIGIAAGTGGTEGREWDGGTSGYGVAGDRMVTARAR